MKRAQEERTGRALGGVVLVLLLLAGGAAAFMGVRAWSINRANGASSPGGTSKAQNAGASSEKIDAILNSAQQYVNQGEAGKAEVILKEATATYPDEQRLWVQYAELLAVMKRPSEAYSLYEKALAIGPRTGDVEFGAGTVASMAGRLDRAAEHYGAAQSHNRQDWRAALFLGQVQVKLDRLEEAKANLLLAAKLKPDLAVAWGTLADVAMRQNKTGIALQHIAKARELEPDVTMWRLIQARALKRDGKPDQALLLLVGLDEYAKRETGVMPLMAECYGMLQKPEDAARMYSAASDSDGARGDWAFEAALWWERAGNKDAALTYAKHAEMLAVKGAPEVVARLSK